MKLRDVSQVPPTLEVKGRVWTFLGVVFYVRKDGQESQYLRWRGHCAKCGAAFETTSGLQWERSHGGFQWYCPEHRKRIGGALA